MPDQLIKGLPEGVELTGDFLPTTANDYELMRIDGQTAIYKGARAGSASGIKVKPAKGYVFVQTGHESLFDQRAYKQVPGRPQFIASKEIPPKTTTVMTKFTVNNEHDAAALEEALKTLVGMPGFISIGRNDVQDPQAPQSVPQPR